MKFDDIKIVKKPLVRASAKEVDELAKRLWIAFPDGYREYITQFGEGTLGGSLIRIYPPLRIEKELADWRRRINKYWFWDAGRDVLPKERALECILIGDTTNGDEIVFHPTRPQTIFMLPRDSDDVFAVTGNLLAAIDWICTSGKLVEPFDERDFEPFDSREESDDGASDEATDPDGESLDEIIELGKNWAKRHAAKKQAMKELRAQVPKGTSSEMLHESIIIEGDTSLDLGYSIAWRIVDEVRGKEMGVFRWTMNDDSSAAAFEPKK